MGGQWKKDGERKKTVQEWSENKDWKGNLVDAEI